MGVFLQLGTIRQKHTIPISKSEKKAVNLSPETVTKT
jgi:hypothetical protein